MAHSVHEIMSTSTKKVSFVSRKTRRVRTYIQLHKSKIKFILVTHTLLQHKQEPTTASSTMRQFSAATKTPKSLTTFQQMRVKVV